MKSELLKDSLKPGLPEKNCKIHNVSKFPREARALAMQSHKRTDRKHLELRQIIHCPKRSQKSRRTVSDKKPP